METEAAYKRCSNGHYYQGDHCPYCNAQTQPIIDKIEESIPDTVNLDKVCPNGHTYRWHLNRCPYCGEEIYVDKVMPATLFIKSLKITFDTETMVKVDDIGCRVKVLEVVYNHNRYRSGYHIEDMPTFNYKSIIQIGGKIFKGSEFIQWVDFMIGIGGMKIKEK